MLIFRLLKRLTKIKKRMNDMRIFGFDLVRHDHYEHLVKECTHLAIENVHLNKDLTIAECKVKACEAKVLFYEEMNKELHNRLSKKNAKRDKNGRFIKK